MSTCCLFFFNDTATTEIYTLSLHDALPILVLGLIHGEALPRRRAATFLLLAPIPLLAYLAPIEGWTVATAYEGNVLGGFLRSEEHTSELQSQSNLVCRLLLETKKASSPPRT